MLFEYIYITYMYGAGITVLLTLILFALKGLQGPV